MDDEKLQQSESQSQGHQTSVSPSPSPSPPNRRDNKKNIKNKNKIVINISDCQYPVVSKVAKHFKWKRQHTAETMDWDICWTDNAVQPQTLTKMELHQKINHFPGMYNLARKNLLGRGLMRMRKKFPEQYNFFPLTWMLPVEYHELKAYFEGKAKGKARTFIVKPQCMSQGKGIFLTRKLQDINPTNHCVVQRYLHKPYLIEGLKFDLRVYVLIASVDPLTIYLYEQGLGRFATEKYEAPNRQNMEEVCMHLTNYAINKDNPKFIFNQSQKDMSKGHKRSLTAVYDLLKIQGVDVVKLKQKIKDCIVKTMISGLPHLTNTYKSCQPESYSSSLSSMCFQLLGFDVMLNDKAEPLILEINHTPSFATDTPLDQFIKFNYIKDALILMNINEKSRNEILRQQKDACQQRVITGKKIKLNAQERTSMKLQAVNKKLKFQQNHLGGFQRLYPTELQVDPYKQFLEFVEEVYQTSMGGKKIKKIEEIPKPEPVIKPKIKRPTFSTNPDLLNRRHIAQRKYQSKQSINLVQNESKLQKQEQKKYSETNLIKDRTASYDHIMKDRTDTKSKLQTPIIQFKQVIIAKTPQDKYKRMLDNFTVKERQKTEKDIFGDKQMKTIRRLGGVITEDWSEKHINKQRNKFFSKNITLKQKIPIALNTLLINGRDQHNFIVGNLKKYVAGKNKLE